MHTPFALPKTICAYTRQSQFNGGSFVGKYALGLYKSSQGQLCFVKRWEGNVKDIAYKWLLNEASIYRKLSLSKHKDLIRTPRFIDLIEDEHSLTLCIEYIQGEHIRDIEPAKKASIYLSILTFLASHKFTNQMTYRSALYWLLLTPFSALYAVSKHPRYARAIMSALLAALSAAPKLLGRRQKSLVHRDLNDNNVLVTSQGVYLLDFELTILADPLIDLAIVLLKHIDNQLFITALKKSVYVHELLRDAQTSHALSAYMSIFAIYDLCFADGLHQASRHYLKDRSL